MPKTNLKNRLGGIGIAFSDKNFRLYSIGAIATWIGFFVQLVAVSWHAWELTHSTTWLAIIALLDIVPNVVLMPLTGAIADRFDKYRLMGIVSLLALIQAVIIAVLAWTNQLTLFPFAVLVFLHGVIISFMVPAMYGILPRFVKRSSLTSAIAVSSSYSQLAVFLGPAIAGWLISGYGVVAAFTLNALGYLVYLIVWPLFKTPPSFIKPEKSSKSIYADIKAGAKYIFNHQGISSMLVILLVGDALAASIFYMAPAFSEQILGLGVVGVSMILAAKGIGATIAAFWVAHGGEKMATVKRMLWGFLFFIVAVFIIFLSKNLSVIIISFVVLGMAAETYHTIMTALVQLSVSEEQRGRVMGTLFMFAQFASGLGTYLVGYFAVSYGLVTPTLVLATLCFVIWLIYFKNRDQIRDRFQSRPSL